jgi:hypothetical protein
MLSNPLRDEAAVPRDHLFVLVRRERRPDDLHEQLVELA